MSTDPQRPGDPFTSQDATRLFADLIREIRGINAPVATILKRVLDMTEQLSRIEDSLSVSRINRMEIELREAELERQTAEENLKRLEEKVQIKTNIKETGVDTQERLRVAASTALANAEKEKRADSEAFIKDLKRGAVKAIVNGLSFGGVMALLGFIWFLIQLYTSRGSP